MRKATNKLRTVLIDVLGVLLIILSLLFGWIPGVGGIPLFIGGLALLATNHEWARNWLTIAKDKSRLVWEIVFRDNAQLKLFYDISGVIIVCVSIYVFSYNLNSRFFNTVSLFTLAIGVILLLGNRKRLEKIQDSMLSLFRK